MQNTDRPAAAAPEVDGYRAMLRIRLVEEAVQLLHQTGRIAGSVHLCNGQEAIPVAICGARRPDDPVFATYRGHGWALACGVTPERLVAELCGRASGTNGGRAGSAYLSDPDVGFYGENSIVGASGPIATGAALASRFDQSGRVAVSVFGDGALNQGALLEALNFAAVLALPVVFVCENNGYSELTPIAAMVRDPMLTNRAIAFGMPGLRVDGNDITALGMAARQAFDRARAGGGPTFIEAMTRRIVGHYIGDAQAYRPRDEFEGAKHDEPLARIRRSWIDGGMTDADLRAIESPVREEIEGAVASALRAPLADATEVLQHVVA